MPRKARQKAIFSTYYIYQEAKKALFRDNKEKDIFLKVLKKVKEKYDFKLYAFCLKDNYYKLVIFDNGNDITKIMKSINVSFTMRVNNKREEKGKIFEQRFKSHMITEGKDLLAFSKNVHIDSKSLDACYSSYCAYFKEDYSNPLIDTDIIIKGIVADDQKKTYEMYIHENEPLEEVNCEYDFYECVKEDSCIQSKEEAKRELKNILRKKELSFSEMIKDKQTRNQLIRKFRKQSTLTLKELGEIFGNISPSGVCKILNKE